MSVTVRDMTQKSVIVLACDGCGATGDDVATHAVKLDATPYQVEACGRCWPDAIVTTAALRRARGGRNPAPAPEPAPAPKRRGGRRKLEAV